MAHDPELFESAWLKWSWAVAHSHVLNAYIAAWRSDPERDPSIGLIKHYNAKHHRIDISIDRVAPLPIEWGLVIGDIANCYRCCLDQIAWALVEHGRTPPATLNQRAQRKIYFPIYDFRTDFNNALPINLPGVHRADIAVVRGYQPYHGRKQTRANHAFNVLARISNGDKHRTVQPAQSAPRGSTYEITDVKDCVISRIPASFVTWDPLQVGAQLAPIYVRRTGPQPHVDLKVEVAAQPAIEGVVLGEWLTVMPPYVSGLLGTLSDPPTELLTKLGDSAPSS